MSDLIPRRTQDLQPTVGGGLSAHVADDRRTTRALVNIERHTVVRLASVRGHALVQGDKVDEIDRLARRCIVDQAMLSKLGATLAQDDAFLADDLKFFVDLAKIGKGEILTNTISDFSREGR